MTDIFVDNFMIYNFVWTIFSIKLTVFKKNLKNPKILTLTLNNFFSPHEINKDFWHFISTGVSKVSTKI